MAQHHAYDASDRPTAIERADGATRHIAYDDSGLVVSRTDANGRDTTFRRDALGRVVEVTDPADRSTLFGYDDAGNPTTITDADGRTTTNAYDDAGQLVATSYSSDQPGDVSYTYTDDGLGQTMTDDTGTTTFTYDALNRLPATRGSVCSAARPSAPYHTASKLPTHSPRWPPQQSRCWCAPGMTKPSSLRLLTKFGAS